jgi:hypothetical protein
MGFLGRPRGRIVDSRARLRIVRSVYESLPNGLPRLTRRGNAARSAPVCGELT